MHICMCFWVCVWVWGCLSLYVHVYLSLTYGVVLFTTSCHRYSSKMDRWNKYQAWKQLSKTYSLLDKIFQARPHSHKWSKQKRTIKNIYHACELFIYRCKGFEGSVRPKNLVLYFASCFCFTRTTLWANIMFNRFRLTHPFGINIRREKLM